MNPGHRTSVHRRYDARLRGAGGRLDGDPRAAGDEPACPCGGVSSLAERDACNKTPSDRPDMTQWPSGIRFGQLVGNSHPMAEIVIAAGKPYLVTTDERRAAVSELARRLGSLGLDVDVEIVEYEPGRRGLGPNMPELVGIFIGTQVAASVIDRLTNAIIDRTKEWAGERFNRKRKTRPSQTAKPESFTLYGPDGEVLKTWTIDNSGEHEDYPEQLQQPRKNWRTRRRSPYEDRP